MADPNAGSSPAGRIAERIVASLVAALFLLLTAGMYDRLGDLRVELAEVKAVATLGRTTSNELAAHLADPDIHEGALNLLRQRIEQLEKHHPPPSH